jgi:pantoate--beta-alanine ligase
MRRLVRVEEVRAALAPLAAAGRRLAFVPTMGSLHDGHLELVRAARAAAPATIVSIFVNPAQFGPNMDLARYPRDLEGDEAKLAALGVDFVFAPEVEEIYPPGFSTWVEVEGLSALLDGASRPGYFRGICTVVAKLFCIVRPDVALFGQKDLQQALVIRRLARDLDLAIDVRVEATVRAADGLALSSRNAYLSAAERERAPVLYRALRRAQGLFERGERTAERLVAEARSALAAVPEFVVDYVEVVSLAGVERLVRVDQPACIAAAAVLGETRLIDNVLLLEPGAEPPWPGSAGRAG